MAAPSNVEAMLAELYQSPPREFTEKREALAKELEQTGDKAAARSVRSCRKPTRIAWVLNVLAHRHPKAIEELLDAGRELALAQRRAIRGEAGASFRESLARQRDVVTNVTARAATVMKELDLEPTGHLDEIASALQAALVNPAVGGELAQGQLVKPPVAAGLGELPLGEATQRSDNGRGRRERAGRTARTTAKARAAQQASRRRWGALVSKTQAALRKAEATAKKKTRAAAKADAVARTRIERARELAAEAEAASRAAEKAKQELARARANPPHEERG